jgi:hypothetical protein
VFTPNTVQIPRFIIGALREGASSHSLAIATIMVHLDIVPSDPELHGISRDDIEMAKQSLAHGRYVPYHRPAPAQPEASPAAGVDDEDDPYGVLTPEPASPASEFDAFAAHLQSQIDARVKRPEAFPAHRMRDIARKSSNRLDVAEALVAMIERYEKRGNTVNRPSGFILRVLEKSSVDEILAEVRTPEAPTRPRTLGDDVYQEAVRKVGAKASTPSVNWDAIEQDKRFLEERGA